MYQSSTRTPPLHQWDIPDSSSLPLAQQKRKATDVICIIFGILFAIILLIIAIVLYNKNNIQLTKYPADSNGVVCMINAENNNIKYPLIWFNDIRNGLKDRYCVEKCPVNGIPTNCYGDGLQCQINYYPNYESSDRFGSYCLPNDQKLRNQLLESAYLDVKFNAIKSIDYFFIGLGVSFGLAIFWFLLVQFLPRIAVWTAFILSAILLIIAAVIFFYASNNHLAQYKGYTIFFGIVFLLLFGLLIYYMCVHRRQLQICACFLDIAGDCLKANLTSLLYILLFIVLTILFCLLLFFQYLAFSSSGSTTLNGVFQTNSKNWFLMLLLVIQGIWGLSFFRDAFNYVISGIADQWYFHKLGMCCYPLKRLITKNLGSLIGGSFLTGFFYIPALIISFLAPSVDCSCCNLFDLSRTDVYSYIYLTGNSYCPSSRQTRYLCQRSNICRENESVMSIYAFLSRVVISIATVLIIYWIARDNLIDQKIPFLLLGGVFFICMYISCYFTDIHAIIGEALMICFLTEYDLEEGWTYKDMKACPEKLSQLINDVDNRSRR